MKIPKYFDDCFVRFVIADDGLSLGAEIYDKPDGELVGYVDTLVVSETQITDQTISDNRRELVAKTKVFLFLEQVEKLNEVSE